MSATDEMPRGKLFFGLLARDEESLARVVRRLSLDYSQIDISSSVIRTDSGAVADPETHYAFQQWIATELPPQLTEFVEIKRFTRRVEAIFTADTIPLLNINPGYVTSTKVVMLKSDDADHRFFLQRGVYAEPLFRFTNSDNLEEWPWTRVEFQLPQIKSFFIETRARFLAALHDDFGKI